jgi:hypothetical protein
MSNALDESKAKDSLTFGQRSREIGFASPTKSKPRKRGSLEQTEDGTFIRRLEGGGLEATFFPSTDKSKDSEQHQEEKRKKILARREKESQLGAGLRRGKREDMEDDLGKDDNGRNGRKFGRFTKKGGEQRLRSASRNKTRFL